MQSTSNLPLLSKITEKTKCRLETPESIRKYLMPVQELDLSDSYSQSDVSDAFDELHKDSFLSRVEGQKPISKLEADRLTMAQFTEDFKNTALEIRKELEIGDNMMRESMDDIQKILTEDRESKGLPHDLQERINYMLKDEDHIQSTPSQFSEASRRESSATFDAQSGLWRMLSLQDTKDKFRVSSPTYNAFEQNEPHWLENPAVPWQILDQSKRKCLNWLSEQHKA